MGVGLAAAQAESPPSGNGSVSPAMLDDAALHAVCFVDDRHGWAVGDRGVIRATADGGRTWALQATPVECRLATVSFLDTQRGWAAGGVVHPYTHKSTGVLLRTVDGGQHWQPVEGTLLPAISKLAMLDERRGFAVGVGSHLFPTGVFTTSDGGRSWSAARGELWGGWLAGDMRPDGTGATAGRDGQLATIRGMELTAGRQPALGLRGLRALQLHGATGGWLVGDGGLAMTTSDGGLTWQLPPGPLPPGLERACDFAALATVGAHVWIAGSPGAFVLHSPDSGRHWELLPTGQTLPIAGLAFVDEHQGWAVGALGTILATQDGGRTWRRQRSGGTRAALLAIVADAAELPLEVLANEAGNEGYLAVAQVVGRRDLEGTAPPEAHPAHRVHDALVQIGACGAGQGWRFPLRQAGLEVGADLVVATWDRANDGRGTSRLEEELVRTIRQWRPDVLVLPSPQRALAPAERVVAQVVLAALDKAGDEGAYPEHAQYGLPPWRVKKAWGLLPPEEHGSINLPAAQLAPRLGRSLGDLATAARGLLHARQVTPPVMIGLELLVDRLPQGSGRGGLFSGLALQPGGEARRPLDQAAAANLDQLRRLAGQQRNLQQLIARSANSPLGGATILAQLDDLTRGLGEPAAVDLLLQLAVQYQQQGHPELAAETYGALLERHPKHPATEAAAIWLLRYYASAEQGHRLRREQRIQAGTGQIAGENDGSARLRPLASAAPAANAVPPPAAPLASAVEPSLPGAANAAPRPALASSSPGSATLIPAIDPADEGEGSLLTWPGAARPGTPRASSKPGAQPFAPSGGPQVIAPAAAVAPLDLPEAAAGAALDERHERALQLARFLERSRPALFADKAIRFPIAAATRALGLKRDAEKLYASLAAAPQDDAWRAAARCEQWIVRPTGLPAKPLATAVRARARPRLDGQLDEPVWQAAATLELRSPMQDDAAWPAAVKLAHDAEFLYLAVSCAKAVACRYEPSPGPRSYDADLTGRDRVELLLDVDRDYATYFRFTVDARGWTSEACCEDRRWNPAWYVATSETPEAWSAECAIPLEELVAQSPQPGAVWAVGVQRAVPNTGFQSWTQPAAIAVRPEGFGLLVLE